MIEKHLIGTQQMQEEKFILFLEFVKSQFLYFIQTFANYFISYNEATKARLTQSS